MKNAICYFLSFLVEGELIVYGITKRFAPHFLDNGREFHHLLVFTIFTLIQANVRKHHLL